MLIATGVLIAWLLIGTPGHAADLPAASAVEKAPYGRIISLYGAHTENLVALAAVDLLIGIDLLEAARSIDPRLPYRVASPKRTAVNGGRVGGGEACRRAAPRHG